MKFLANQTLVLLWILAAFPLFFTIGLSFVSNSEINQWYLGYYYLFEPFRFSEISTIITRSAIIALLSTILAYNCAYLLRFFCSIMFRRLFLISISLPFLITESIRVFSWQFLLSENGFLNFVIRSLLDSKLTLFSGSTIYNSYFAMVLTCLPFGIFIIYGALLLIPDFYRQQATELNITEIHQLTKIFLPMTKHGVLIAYLVLFIVASSLSSEINFLGGDTKISLRSFITSLQSVGKHQSVYALGSLYVLFCAVISFLALRKVYTK